VNIHLSALFEEIPDRLTEFSDPPLDLSAFCDRCNLTTAPSNPTFPLSSSLTQHLRMSEGNQDTVLRIGKSHGLGGGRGGERPIVVKGKSAQNAAFRSGIVQTEKKYGSANSVSLCLFG
jgi:Multiprotein bridging factor 1